MVDMDTPKVITIADLDDLEDLPVGARFELIEGALVLMSPAKQLHGLVVFKISLLIGNYVAEHKLGRGLGAETGFRTRGDNKTLRAPDVSFISYAKVPAGELSPEFGTIPPDLAVEVISPGDRAGEIEQKTQEWLTFGVSLVWVVYPDTQRVHIYDQSGQVRILDATQQIDGSSVLPGFTAPISAFFED